MIDLINYEEVIKAIKHILSSLKEEISAVAFGLAIYAGKKFLKKTKNRIQVLIDVKDYTEINNLLIRLNEQTLSDRVFILHFSNPFTNLSQLKYEIRAEVCSSGIKATIDERQNVDVSIFHGFTEKLLNGDCYIVNDTSILKEAEWAELDKHGVKSHLVYPIKQNQKITYALAVEYVSNQHTFTNIDIQKIEKAIAKIKLILS